MEIAQAYEIVTAPFVIESVYQEAEAVILAQCATTNQKALYASLNPLHKQRFLKAIVEHRLVASVLV